MKHARILVVEDDENISKLVRYNLEKDGFRCYATETGEEALDLLAKEKIDLVLLDIMLPKMDGLDTCKLIKQNKQLHEIPIIMLTAKGEEIDRIVGLELGADDYIVKPFSPRELILRIKAVLKRKVSISSEDNIIQCDNLKMDIVRHEVLLDNDKITLTSMEFKLLELLMKRRGRVQSRDKLLNDVWDMDADVTTRTVDTHIKRLRKKLGNSDTLIETIRGFGYRFKDEEY